MNVVQRVSGVLIFFSFIFTIYAYFFQENILILAISFIWLASILLFFTLEKKNLIYILLFCSFISFLYSYINGFYIDFFKALSVNQYLLTLLIAVGFLKLIATPRKEKNTELPKGKNSFLKTYLSVHLFGSVINLFFITSSC